MPRGACRSISQKLVADAAQRLEQRLVRGLLELGAQPAHVDIEQVGVDVVVRGPDLLGDQRAGEDASGVLHEDLEQRKLAPREIDRLAVDMRGVTQQVEK